MKPQRGVRLFRDRALDARAALLSFIALLGLLSASSALAMPIATVATPVELRSPYLCPDPNVVGTSDNDRLVGTNGSDVMIGLAGDDVFVPRAGTIDRVCGGGGDDSVLGDRDSSGTLAVYPGGGNDQVQGSGGGDLLRGGHGQDVISGFEGKDNYLGGSGDDILGPPNDEPLGRDNLSGQGGNDQITAIDPHGTDRVYAGEGNDAVNVVDGGADLVRAGDGVDYCYADAVDYVYGCENVETGIFTQARSSRMTPASS